MKRLLPTSYVRLMCSMFVGVALLSSVGCGKSGPQTGIVEGKITLNGEPGANLIVTFTPAVGGRPSVGTTNESGAYKLNFNAMTEGAIIGEHAVTIQQTPSSRAQIQVTVVDGAARVDPASVAAVAAEQRAARKNPTIPAKYGRESILTASVKKGSNTIDFDLKF